eukprot:3391176-Amphidinium_carterae.1
MRRCHWLSVDKTDGWSQSLTQLGAILDCRQGILYLTGDREGHVELPPGGQAYPLFRAPSENLHLRIAHFDLLQRAVTEGVQPVQRHLLTDQLDEPTTHNDRKRPHGEEPQSADKEAAAAGSRCASAPPPPTYQ